MNPGAINGPIPLDGINAFLERSDFVRSGGVVTDLDGTAVHEREGRVAIPDVVAEGLKALHEQGRPIILNTLRFPLNVIQTFGREWYAITNAPLPLISLNGGLIGHLAADCDGGVVFHELAAFPLGEPDIDEVLAGVNALLAGGVDDIILFYYPRDWRKGELVWTPRERRVQPLLDKYSSASRVYSSPVPELREALARAEPCMILLLVDAPQDRLMAYQHVRPSSFVTCSGVNKRSGLAIVAERLGLELRHCVGAGDTPMDAFLADVGLAVHVGGFDLEFHGMLGTVKVRDSLELGEVLFHLAERHAPGQAR